MPGTDESRHRVVACGVALCGLAACGFRLAGSDPLPGVLARPYLSLKDPYTDFSREFEHQLKSSGRAAAAVSRQVPPPPSRSPRIWSNSGRCRFSAQHSDRIRTDLHRDLCGAGAAQAVAGAADHQPCPRTIAFDEHALLAKDHEADILRAQMARDLVAIAMRRLTSLK